MRKEKNTLVQWFGWWGWYPDKLEAWLEAKAAKGWHLTKADWLLLRFHFQRGAPRTVRVCVDYPSNPTEEYRTIFGDAGWEVVAERSGWYIWRTEYDGAQRPEIFNGVDGLIERNQRFLTILLASFAALAAQIPASTLYIRRISFAPMAFKMILAVYTLLLVIIVVSLIATIRQISKLKSRKR